MKMSLTNTALCALLTLTASTALAGDDFQREGNAKQRAAKDPLEGKAPPPLKVEGWLNVEAGLELAKLKGKVILLDFWGVWCGPCRAAIPHLRELYKKHKDEGLVIIGIHTSGSAEKMPDFVKVQGINYPVAADVKDQTVKAFAVDSYPDYYLIDRAGKLRVADLKNTDLDRTLALLLAEKAP